MRDKLSNDNPTICVSDIFERVDELEELHEASEDKDAFGNTEEGMELACIQSVLSDLCGNGGDEQWRGDWYPSLLIRHTDFRDYCKELVEDIGGLPKDIPSYLVIDWDETARNLKVDYSEVEFQGVTYLFRVD